jgi:hypothetical protein
MFLEDKGTGSKETVESADSVLGASKKAFEAFKNYVADIKDVKGVYENIEKIMIGLQDSSLALQRGMGGVLSNTSNFRERLIGAYSDTIKIGATFEDVTGAVKGLSDGMGKIVSPSKETVVSMVELSKATQMSTSEIGGMVSEMVRFGGTQKQATEQISKMAKEGRLAGLNGKAYTEAIGKNLKSVSGFGFKSGVDGMKKMVKEAMLLRTSIESIGASKLAADVLDPEKALETAAAFQMMGGAVGKLSDPFQLLHMAQTDIAGIQEELVKSTKSAFKFNNETGNFDIATQDMYRLREQAALTNTSLEDLVNAGREGAKLDFLKDKFDLDNLPEEQQALISQLATVGENGNLSVDIPGLDKPITAESPEQLQAALRTEEAQKALADYQANMNLTDRQIAEQQLTVQEKQTAIQNEIKMAVISSMSQSERETFANNIAEANTKSLEAAAKGAKDLAPVTKEGVIGTSEAQKGLSTTIEDAVVYDSDDKEKLRKMAEKVKKQFSGVTVSGQDMMFKSSGAPTIMNEGTLYKGIVGDEIAVGTNLTEAFNKASTISELISKTGKGTTSQNIDGNLKIDINVGGKVDGDKNNDMSKLFSNPIFQKQLMDMVLYKMKDYQKQQGVL